MTGVEAMLDPETLTKMEDQLAEKYDAELAEEKAMEEWDARNSVLYLKYMFEGITSLTDLSQAMKAAGHRFEELAVEHELSDSVDGGWVPVRRKDGEPLTADSGLVWTEVKP